MRNFQNSINLQFIESLDIVFSCNTHFLQQKGG